MSKLDNLTAEIVANMSDAELTNGIATLEALREKSESKYSTAQLIISKNSDEALDMLNDIAFILLPQLTFKIELASAVAIAHNFVTDAISNKCVTMTPMKFKNFVRAISTTEFKGSETAIVLDKLSNMLESVAKAVAEIDAEYRNIVENLDLLYQEVDSRKLTAEVSTDAAIEAIEA